MDLYRPRSPGTGTSTGRSRDAGRLRPTAARRTAALVRGGRGPHDRLAEPVRFTDLDLSPPSSAINQKWPTPPDGYQGSIPVSTLFSLALQLGDRTATDILMKRIGGPGDVSAWLQAKGDHRHPGRPLCRAPAASGTGQDGNLPRPAWKDQAAFEAARDQAPAPDRQAAMNAYLADPRDSTTVPAMLNFLYKLAYGELLSPASTTLLLKWMERFPHRRQAVPRRPAQGCALGPHQQPEDRPSPTSALPRPPTTSASPPSPAAAATPLPGSWPAPPPPRPSATPCSPRCAKLVTAAVKPGPPFPARRKPLCSLNLRDLSASPGHRPRQAFSSRSP